MMKFAPLCALALACGAMAFAPGVFGQHQYPRPPEKSETPQKSRKPADKKQADTKKPNLAIMTDKASLLADLYGRLAKAKSQNEADTLSGLIEQVWIYTQSDTTLLLMERSAKALNDKDKTTAREILDGVVTLDPDYAEAFNRRAYVAFLEKDYAEAIEDLRRVLALDRRHFKALGGLATILREIGDKRGALKVYRTLLEVNPHSGDAKEGIKELEGEVEGLKI
jgi:tetratricopeptide (TPR) repeat protein